MSAHVSVCPARQSVLLVCLPRRPGCLSVCMPYPVCMSRSSVPRPICLPCGCLPMMPCPSVYSDRLSILTFCLPVCMSALPHWFNCFSVAILDVSFSPTGWCLLSFPVCVSAVSSALATACVLWV